LKIKDFQLTRARDLDLGSGHTAYHHASVIDHRSFDLTMRHENDMTIYSMILNKLSMNGRFHAVIKQVGQI